MFGAIKSLKAKTDYPRIIAQAEGSEKAVPNREERRVIRVGFGLVAGMVNFVHGWRNDQATEDLVEGFGQADVSMVELDHREEECLI